MDAGEIKAALHAKGLSFAIVAEALGVTAPSVSNVAHRRQRGYRSAHAIAAALGLPIERVFPDVKQYHHPAPLNLTPEQRRARVAKVRAAFRAVA